MAENLDAQLKRMVQDLKEIIEHLNASNSSQDSNDPVSKPSRVPHYLVGKTLIG